MDVIGSGGLGEDGQPEVNFVITIDSDKFLELTGSAIFNAGLVKDRIQMLEQKITDLKARMSTNAYEKRSLSIEVERLKAEIERNVNVIQKITIESQKVISTFELLKQENNYLRGELYRSQNTNLINLQNTMFKK